MICEYKKRTNSLSSIYRTERRTFRIFTRRKSKTRFLLSIKNDSTLNKDTFELDTDKYILFGMRFFTDDDNNNSQKWNDELKNEFKG
ncbi:hypothetical protein OFS03_07140 [Brachyspira hyodysenteriae]|nr:hypothetical protein [Brachyspira hyodysenteriae]MDA0062990.1 hypothetical protein [Brachyspira hyodysenteriae]MDA0072317.1 hypothetical protein [Brachyspira hyodysenteriae]